MLHGMTEALFNIQITKVYQEDHHDQLEFNADLWLFSVDERELQKKSLQNHL